MHNRCGWYDTISVKKIRERKKERIKRDTYHEHSVNFHKHQFLIMLFHNSSIRFYKVSTSLFFLSSQFQVYLMDWKERINCCNGLLFVCFCRYFLRRIVSPFGYALWKVLMGRRDEGVFLEVGMMAWFSLRLLVSFFFSWEEGYLFNYSRSFGALSFVNYVF